MNGKFLKNLVDAKKLLISDAKHERKD